MISTILQLGLVLGLALLALRERRIVTGRYPSRWFWLACLLGVVAVIVGTVVDLSGVLLGVPVTVVSGIVVARGGWPIGDAGLLLIVLGTGMGGGYLLAAALDPDTGSFADQGAQALVALGGLVCTVSWSWSLLRGHRRRRRAGSLRDTA